MEHEDNQLFECEDHNLYTVLDTLKVYSELLSVTETEELVKEYRKLFPPENGICLISDANLDKLVNHILSMTLSDLVDKGMINMTWSDESNDFVFYKNDNGN
jgi:hypothetical protein